MYEKIEKEKKERKEKKRNIHKCKRKKNIKNSEFLKKKWHTRRNVGVAHGNVQRWKILLYII